MKHFLYQAGLLLFDDQKNDLRALPKTVRLQILVVLSLMWSVIFTLMFWSYKVWGMVLTTSVLGSCIGHHWGLLHNEILSKCKTIQNKK